MEYRLFKVANDVTNFGGGNNQELQRDNRKEKKASEKRKLKFFISIFFLVAHCTDSVNTVNPELTTTFQQRLPL
jgi:hypothetical protein